MCLSNTGWASVRVLRNNPWVSSNFREVTSHCLRQQRQWYHWQEMPLMPPVTIAACALNGQNQLAYVQNIFFFFFFLHLMFAIVDYHLVGNFCGTKWLLWCNLFCPYVQQWAVFIITILFFSLSFCTIKQTRLIIILWERNWFVKKKPVWLTFVKHKRKYLAECSSCLESNGKKVP